MGGCKQGKNVQPAEELILQHVFKLTALPREEQM